MLVPTDAAWNVVYNKLLESHIYGTYYEDKSKGDEGASASAIAVKVDPDSLQRISTKMDIIAPLVFNVNKQPKRRRMKDNRRPHGKRDIRKKDK